MLVINFIRSQPEVIAALDTAKFNFEKDVFYDLSSSNFELDNKVKVLQPVINFGVTKSFLEEYEENFQRASAAIFKYCFLGYPLYWITELSEKHSYNIHYRLFLLKNDIQRLKELIKEHVNIMVYLPSTKRQFSPIINEFFKKQLNYNLAINFLHDSKKTINSFRYNWRYARSELKKFKTLVNNVRNQLNAKKNDGAAANGYIFTYYPQSWNSTTKSDYAIGYLNDYSPTSLKYIPFVHSLKSLESTLEFNMPAELVKSYPGKIQTFIFGLLYIKLFFKIRKTPLKDKSSFEETAISQMEVALNKDSLCMLFFRMWLSNFFKQIKQPINIFYQDEFYIPGRIISDAAKPYKNVISNGVQHGMIFGNHTVYFVSKAEVSGKFQIPRPKQFYVWGEYFKSIIRKNSSFSGQNITVLGNMKYKQSEATIFDNENCTFLLWCTGLAGVMDKEAKFVCQLANGLGNCKIIVRMHPLHNVKKELMLTPCYERFKDNFSFSDETDIQADFKRSNLVLSTSSSGVILEAAFANKVVIAVPSDFYDIDKINHPAVFQPSKAEDILIILPKIKLAIKADPNTLTRSLDEIVYTKPDVLKKVLNFEIENSK